MKTLATIVVASVLVGLVVVSVRTMSALRAERLAEQKSVQREVGKVDFYFDQLRFQQYDASGRLVQQLDAHRVEHYEDDNRFILSRPTFTFFHPKEQPWVITAIRGVSSNGRDLVNLSDRVNVVRERGKYNSRVQINTEQLRVHTDLRTADTALAVSFLEDANLMRGVGASIDFNQGVIKLISQIHIWYKLNF